MKFDITSVKFRPLEHGERIQKGDFYRSPLGHVVIRDFIPWRQKNKGKTFQHYRITRIEIQDADKISQ